MIPKGMNYQAVVRDAKGSLLADENIALQITLFSNEGERRIDYYKESHTALTSGIGLFNLVVGEGTPESGQYALIPWNTENIWMEVTIKDKATSSFRMISNGKLLAVPYAIYAGSANKLTGLSGTTITDFAPPEPGVVSNDWSVFGNAKTDEAGNPYRVNSLGTTDLVDLIMITDNVERLRILSSGDIFTKLNFEIGKNLNVVDNAAIQQTLMIGDTLLVKKNVLFNVAGGSTTNYGPFSVIHFSPTWLTGSLIVDKATLINDSLAVQGPTNLNSRLFVNNMSPVHLTGTLMVDKIADINDALNVNNMKPSLLTGTLTVDKATTLQDSFSVNNMSPSYMTGTLTVDKSTNLNDSLTVDDMGPTKLSGTLTVDKESFFNDRVLLKDTTQSTSSATGALVVTGGLGLGGNLNVGGASTFGGPVGFESPVSITDISQSNSPNSGALIVAGGAGIGRNLNVGGTLIVDSMTTIKNLTQSFNTTTGALKVTGGVGIAKNLNIGGMTNIAGIMTVLNGTNSNDAMTGALKVVGGTGIGKELNVGGMTSILDPSNSNNIGTGALKISGGVGISRQLNVGGMTSILNENQTTNLGLGALIVNGGTGIGLQLNVGGMGTILDVTNSFNSSSGSLKVSGGMGIVGKLNVGQRLTVTGLTTLNGYILAKKGLFVTANTPYIASFVKTTSINNGISIKVNNPSPGWANNFIEFRKNGGGVVGRIEGENLIQYLSNPNYIRELEVLDFDITFAEITVATASMFVVAAAAELVAALSSSTACIGFGACATAPVASFIAKAGLAVTARAVGLGLAVARRDEAKDQKTAYIAYKGPPRVGVTYESGNGDYAEWLEKADPQEVFLPGHIIGIKNGKISKTINKDTRALVISTKPIVLGNMPVEGNESSFEKVAFLGQVPVYVSGSVEPGDYILPSGFNDGLGKAVHPDQLDAADYAQVVGVAWSSASNDQPHLILTAIGLNEGDISKVILENKNEIQELKTSLDKSDVMLSKLLPEYALRIKAPAEESAKFDEQKALSLVKEMDAASPYNALSQNYIKSIAGQSDYSEVSRQQVMEVLNMAEITLLRNGGNEQQNSFFRLLKTDASSQDFYIKTIQGIYKHAVQLQLAKNKATR